MEFSVPLKKKKKKLENNESVTGRVPQNQILLAFKSTSNNFFLGRTVAFSMFKEAIEKLQYMTFCGFIFIFYTFFF
jgi:hypothetical protein